MNRIKGFEKISGSGNENVESWVLLRRNRAVCCKEVCVATHFSLRRFEPRHLAAKQYNFIDYFLSEI